MRGLDIFAVVPFFLPPLSLASAFWTVTTDPFFRCQPAALGVGPRSGAGATLTRFFRCFAKENSLFLQLRVFLAGSFGGEVGAKAEFALKAGARLAAKPILTDFMKQSSLYLLQRYEKTNLPPRGGIAAVMWKWSSESLLFDDHFHTTVLWLCMKTSFSLMSTKTCVQLFQMR